MSQSIQRYRVALSKGKHFDGNVSGCIVHLDLPEDAHVLRLHCQDHILHLLVQCNVDTPTRSVGLYLVGASHALPDLLGPYLGSFKDQEAGELHAFLVSGQNLAMDRLT